MSNPPFVHSFCHPQTRKAKFPASGSPPSFDFVVVGGGPAGCALATRLAEGLNGKHSVLLVEQGPSVEDHPELRNCVNHIMQTRFLHGSTLDAAYPADTTDQFNPSKLTINSGKVLGGSSCINWAIWTRGPKDDYDLWAEQTGNPEFKWDNMAPLFENIESPTGGPIPIRSVASSPRPHFWSATAALSLEQSGFKHIGNVNGGDLLGYGQLVECIDEQGRANASRYIYGYDGNPDAFEVWTNLKAEGLELEGQRATGIKTKYGIIKARKEVILTASSVQDAVLLLLSGIGPKEELTKHGIPVNADLPVGENLWDHPFVDVQLKVKADKRRDTVEDFASLRTSARHVDQWAKTKTGLLSGLPYEWMAFTNIKSHIEAALATVPVTPTDRSILLRTSVPHIEQLLHYGHGLIPAPDPLDTAYISISNVLLTPRSRGSVTLDPSGSGTPHIILNQMKDTVDQEAMVVALRQAFEIFKTEAWSDILEAEEIPEREALLQTIKQRVSTLWHLGGTCSMQTKDTKGVVDNRFRVLGIQGLCVADISVLPFPVIAHTQAVAYAIGEKAARFILEEYSK